ncbi:hypothetical protein M422DRAFT_182795, partial [Sphaerobolus stellatus SS14]
PQPPPHYPNCSTYSGTLHVSPDKPAPDRPNVTIPPSPQPHATRATLPTQTQIARHPRLPMSTLPRPGTLPMAHDKPALDNPNSFLSP